jgi:hypothetical protein
VRPLEATTIQSSPANVATAIDDGGPVRHLQFEFSVPASATGNFALPLTLTPSMALGAPLHVASPVDAKLLDGQARIQAQLADWSSTFSSVPVTARARARPEGAADGVGAFFSGGLDSFCTLHTHRDEITHLILIHGFDVWLSDRAIRKRIAEMAHDVGRAFDIEVIEVATDAKEVMLPLVPWQWYHGGLLAGIAHALEDHISRVLVPATHTLADKEPWGQHPDLDYLWSTARVGVETADADKTRPEKCAIIGESAVAMRWLRVCWQQPGEWNCGRCVKCLRTIIDLAICDRLADCRTFPDTVNVDAVRRLVIRRNSLPYCRATIEAARRNGRCLELADALEVAVRRSRYRRARKRLARIPAGVVDRAATRRRRRRARRGRPSASAP